jgi:hypothetical protein
MAPELQEKAMEESQKDRPQAMAETWAMWIHQRAGQAKIDWGKRSTL